MNVIVTVDLGFGDSGKGTMTDYLCKSRNADWIIRYNGGAQCGHNVQDGTFIHCFCQFGSGSQRPNVKTYLSRHVLFNPVSFVDEAIELRNKGVAAPLAKVWIDPDTPIITPFHVWTNRAKEKHRGIYKHGSCGKGIGELAQDLFECQDDIILASELGDCWDKLKQIQVRKFIELKAYGIDNIPSSMIELLEPEKIAKAYKVISKHIQVEKPNIQGTVICEGAQGVLLDEWAGLHPYTTYSRIVPENVHYILAEIAPHVGCPVEVIGIIRPYMTRHGAGPLPTETDATNIWHNHELNVSNKWQEYFRLGWPDLVLWRYAIDVCKPVLPITALAVTCLDTLNHQFLKVCNGYKYRDTGQHFGTIVPSNEKNLDKQFNLTQLLCNGIDPCYGGDVMDSKEFNMTIEANLECPVTYKSFGPDVSQKTTL